MINYPDKIKDSLGLDRSTVAKRGAGRCCDGCARPGRFCGAAYLTEQAQWSDRRRRGEKCIVSRGIGRLSRRRKAGLSGALAVGSTLDLANGEKCFCYGALA